MSTEKYRKNQSSLSKFLEKKGKPHSPNGYKESSNLHAHYFKKLRDIAETAYERQDIETLARLEAAGCEIYLGNLITIHKLPSLAVSQYEQLVEYDTYDNKWRGTLWTVGITNIGALKADTRYTVAGVVYSSKAEFLLSRTPLGRALL